MQGYIFKIYFRRSWSHGNIEHMTDSVISTTYASLIICINYIINHVPNLSMGPTPIEVKFEDISLEGMTVIYDDSYY